MRQFTCILVAAGSMLGCSVLGADDGPGAKSPEELRSVPQTITIQGTEIVLRTYMWRDFMPISPPDGRPLTAIFWVYNPQSEPLPDGLWADAAWVLNDEEVWGTFFEDDRAEQQVPYELERMARDGPKWGPHVEVDAVVRVRESNGTKHLVRASGQVIERTD